MGHNELIYELSADQNRAHEAFFNQHFVGKRLIYNPHAPMCYITFADGTAVYVTDTSRDNSYDVNMRDHRNTSPIERAWIDETEYTWRSESPDFRLTRGEVTVHAASAHIEPDSTRPRR